MASQNIRHRSGEVPESTTDDESCYPSDGDATEYVPANIRKPLGRSGSKNARDDCMGSWQRNALAWGESNHSRCSRFGGESLPSLDVGHLMANLRYDLIPPERGTKTHRHGTDDDDPYGNESLPMIGGNRPQTLQPRESGIISRSLRDKKNHGDNPYEFLGVTHSVWDSHTGSAHDLQPVESLFGGGGFQASTEDENELPDNEGCWEGQGNREEHAHTNLNPSINEKGVRPSTRKPSASDAGNESVRFADRETDLTSKRPPSDDCHHRSSNRRKGNSSRINDSFPNRCCYGCPEERPYSVENHRHCNGDFHIQRTCCHHCRDGIRCVGPSVDELRPEGKSKHQQDSDKHPVYRHSSLPYSRARERNSKADSLAASVASSRWRRTSFQPS